MTTAPSAEHVARLQQLVEYLARRLVAAPDDIDVQLSEIDDDSLELCVAQEDIGKIIGKQGKMIRALRLVVGAAAAKVDVRMGLEVVEAEPDDDDHKPNPTA